MAAANTDKILRVSNGTAPVPTTLAAGKVVAAPSVSLNSAVGWDTTQAVPLIIYKVDANGAKIAGTQTEWIGTLSGTTVSNLTLTYGTDQIYVSGDVVASAPTGAYAYRLGDALLNQHATDGTHTAITATSLAATGVINASTVGSLQDYSIPLTTYRVESSYDYVASGGVWSGDGYGASRNASMIAMVCYINGRRIAISAVTARSFTASKDTYVDVLDNANGTGTLVYTEQTNNAASPALAANSIRIGIIVTGAANIANVGSVNQGEHNKVLPIASSIAYTVTDSLGNLICPRDSTRRTVGYKQIISDSTALANNTQVPGLSCPVIIPAGRKVKVKIFSRFIAGSTLNAGYGYNIYEGVVGVGTILEQTSLTAHTNNAQIPGNIEVEYTPAGTSLTYNAAVLATGGTTTVSASSSAPAYIKVELV